MAQRTEGRPGVVTFAGLLVLFQALLAGFTATVAILFKNEADFQAVTGRSDSELVWTGLIAGAVGIALLAASMGILTGSDTGRTVATWILGVNVAFGAWTLLTHNPSGMLTTGLLQVAISVVALWALHGSADADEYFSG